MIRSIFENKKKMNKMAKKIRKNKIAQIEVLLIIVGLYGLAKVSARHEIEIANIKKVIGEMKSKGE